LRFTKLFAGAAQEERLELKKTRKGALGKAAGVINRSRELKSYYERWGAASGNLAGNLQRGGAPRRRTKGAHRESIRGKSNRKTDKKSTDLKEKGNDRSLGNTGPRESTKTR